MFIDCRYTYKHYAPPEREELVWKLQPDRLRYSRQVACYNRNDFLRAGA